MRNNIIQEVEEKDIGELYNLLNEAFNSNNRIEKFKELYNLSKNNSNTHILGYYRNDILVGTVSYNVLVLPNEKVITVWNVAVKEEFRKQGIATKLMKRVEEIAKKDADVARIWLFSGSHRNTAHQLYKKLGYDDKYDKAFIKWINRR